MEQDQRLRLPAFAAAGGLEKLLNWVPSVRRQFLEAARRRLGDLPDGGEDAYAVAAALLSRPGGAVQLDALVGQADPKRRGLRAALERGRTLGVEAGPPVATVADVRELCEQVRFEDAAWSALLLLASTDPRGDASSAAELGEVIAAQAGLRQRLGDYWADWRALAAAGEGEAASDEDEPARAWAQEVAQLRAVLAGAESFDPSLPDRLRLAAATLGSLRERAAGEADRRRAAAREQAGARWAAALAGLRAVADGAELAALADADIATADALTLGEAAAWADATQAAVGTAEAAVEAADARSAIDDSEAADEALFAARRQRRTVRKALASAAADWLARLGGEVQAASAVPEPARAEVEPRIASALPEPLEHSAPAPAPAPVPALESGSELEPEPEPERMSVSEPLAQDDADLPAAAADETDDAELDAFLPTPAAAETDEDGAALAAVARRALEEGRYGLAAEVDAAARTLGMPGLGGDPAVLRALAVGAAVSAGRVAPAATAYARHARAIFAVAQRGEPASVATRLLMVAGAIKPAIFASQTGAAEVFRQAEPGAFASVLHDLCELLGDMPKRGGHLDFADLAPAADAQTRRRAADAIRAELLSWVDTASDRRAKFRRADDIIVAVFNAGKVGDAIAAMRRNAAGAGDKARDAADWLDGDLERRVTALDDEARRPRRGAPMEGQVRHRLAQRLGEAATLLRRWAATDRAAQGGAVGHAGELVAQLRRLLAAGADAIGRIGGDADAALAAAVAARLFAEVLRMLDGEEVGDPRLDLDMVIGDDLLLLNPYPALGADGEWTPAAARDLAEGVTAALDGAADHEAAFRRLVDRGRFAEAGRAIDRIVAEGRGERRVLEEQLGDKRRRRRDELTGQAARLRRRLDDVLGADTGGAVDLSMQLRVDTLLRTFAAESQLIDFPAAQAELRALEEAVDDSAQLLLEPLRADIERLDIAPADSDMLRRLADKGDLTTLREQVDAARSGEPLTVPAGGPLKAFAERFLSPAFERTTAAERNTVTLIEAARARRTTPAADFAQLQQEDVPGATELLTAWKDLKAAKGDATARALAALFTALRFTSVKVTAAPPLAPARRFALACDKVEDRGECPVPAFGSSARGRYAVLCLDTVALKNGSELFHLVRRQEAPTTRPTFIVIVGAALPASRRREYMVEARKSGALEPTALIDEATVLSLATRPGRGLSDLFAITLSTGAVQPYSDANGQTSPEMFFGRRSELNQLWDRNGSCLVYGGRQLGKTALLEQLRLRHHRPPTQVVIGGSIDGVIDLWPRLAEWLKAAGVPLKGSHRAGVRQAVRDWLAADGARRLVILADEADIFLQAQMEGGYKDLIEVRDLMHDTERRCKFVFAGLHNVQRLARQPNSPLLHFGTPIRVGPLYGADLGEARAMLEQPMAAAGFTFGSVTLPGRVLSELGYYPSLLQTFGKTTIEGLNRGAAARIKPASPLPLVIGESDIDAALDDPQFRNNVSSKFEATLSLDERYRLITYAMLVHAMERQGHSPALRDVEVQERALSWWPQGFAQDSTLDAFQGLLQEMVGLGVLIEIDGRYAIRSSRIGAMLGGPEEIERKLLELSAKPGTEKLDTGSLRRLDRVSCVPSPLTARQEAVMLAPTDAPAVQLVLGSKALGLDELAASLETAPEDDGLRVERASYANRSELLARVDRAFDRRTLLVLSGPWPGAAAMTDLLGAEQVRRSRRGARRSLQVLVAPDGVDWVELSEPARAGRFAGAELVTLAPLGETGLRQWLRHTAGDASTETIAELRRLTGGYPLFLAGLAGRTPEAVIAQAQAAFERLRATPATFAALGLGDPELKLAAERLAELGDSPDIAEFLRGEGVAEPGAALAQLERLGVLELPAHALAERAVNPFVAALLPGQG